MLTCKIIFLLSEAYCITLSEDYYIVFFAGGLTHGIRRCLMLIIVKALRMHYGIGN